MSIHDSYGAHPHSTEPDGEPIPLAGDPIDEPDIPHAPDPADGKSTRIRTFESSAKIGRTDKTSFNRKLNANGTGATRVRTFHTKLGDAAMKFLDEQINEWIDAGDDIEVKFCSTTVGVVEGKRQEPHLIITVWY